jgi:hypothetical protein
MSKRDLIYPQRIELDPEGPTLAVRMGPPVRDPQVEVHKDFMRRQHRFSDVDVQVRAKKLGWDDEQIQALMDIRSQRGHWC